MRVSTDLIP